MCEWRGRGRHVARERRPRLAAPRFSVRHGFFMRGSFTCRIAPSNSCVPPEGLHLEGLENRGYKLLPKSPRACVWLSMVV